MPCSIHPSIPSLIPSLLFCILGSSHPSGGASLLPQVHVGWIDGAKKKNGRRRREVELLVAVVEHVVDGGLVKELYDELMEMMVVPWDDERKRV